MRATKRFYDLPRRFIYRSIPKDDLTNAFWT